MASVTSLHVIAARARKCQRGTARTLDAPAHVCVSEVPDPVHAEPLIWKPVEQLYDAPPLPHAAMHADQPHKHASGWCASPTHDGCVAQFHEPEPLHVALAEPLR